MSLLNNLRDIEQLIKIAVLFLAGREKILAVLSLWKDTNLETLSPVVSNCGSVFLRKHRCCASNLLTCRGVRFCCSAWHFIICTVRRS